MNFDIILNSHVCLVAAIWDSTDSEDGKIVVIGWLEY